MAEQQQQDRGNNNSPVFRGQTPKNDKNDGKAIIEGRQEMNASILEGDFAPVEIPPIEIPGSKPLVFEQSGDLLG